jgi:hypothetical protein
LDCQKSPTAVYIQKISEIFAKNQSNTLALERNHFCRKLLNAKMQNLVPETPSEEMQNKLAKLFKISLKIVEKANIKVFIYLILGPKYNTFWYFGWTNHSRVEQCSSSTTPSSVSA